MEMFLRGLLPRILPSEIVLDQNCFVHGHEGKSHLVKSIPRKMKAYHYFPDEVRVLIIHDQGSNDCVELKNSLRVLCDDGVPYLIRIVCKELENWYLGDFNALENVFPKIKAEKYARKAKYRIPDKLNGAEELKQLTNRFSKIQTAREICKYIDIERNKSKSFNHFIRGLQKLIS
jgi:hypothetical protein